MPETWKKFIQKQSAFRRERLFHAVKQILTGEYGSLDIVKLKGYENRYRCRIGDIRIIFSQVHGEIEIIAIDKRGDIYK